MLSEKPHLDPGLDLARLARAVGVGSPSLSAILSSEGLSFYEFVNRHRVEEAKRLLRDPRERRTSIEAVGMMSGFRARSTFYEAFRKVTGQTPAEYRRAAGD